MKKLSKKEIDHLLKEAEKAAERSSSLTAVFEDFAKMTGRARGGIRNLYYAILKKSKDDEELKEIYPSLKNLKAEKNRAFSKEEEDELFERVSEGVKDGKSVRKTIRELSGGDEKLALRYQNKYRNVLKRRGEAKKKKREEDYVALRRAIDDLFDRVIKRKSEKEESLKKENESLREEIKILRSSSDESKTKKFFLSRKNGGDDKLGKVPE